MYAFSVLIFVALSMLSKLCIATPTAPPSCVAAVGYAPGMFAISSRGRNNNYFTTFCNGGNATIQGDGNFVIYAGIDHSGDGFSTATNGHRCRGTECVAQFTSDGDFQILFAGRVLFKTDTSGQNAQRIVFSSGQPYVIIYDNDGAELFNSGAGREALKSAAPPSANR